MRNFDYKLLKEQKWDSEIVSYVAQIHEAKGKQAAFLTQKATVLDKLIQVAKIQSTESSNEIEGIKTTDGRLKKLFAESVKPKNRDEEEIAGYRDVLNLIHENYDEIHIDVGHILQLHKLLYRSSAKSIGGRFKNGQNYISATESDGNSFTIFTPLSAFEAPTAVEAICIEFNRAIGESEIEPLLLIPIFIHDFLCIHPFTDDNGRMSRLLTTLLLYKSGYVVGKYISLESKIAKSKNVYYNALRDSGNKWLEGEHDPTKFVKYLLGTIIAAYRDLEERIEIIDEKLPAIDMVRKAVKLTIGKFTKSDIAELCPSLSSSSIEGSLKKLADNSEIEKHDSGKNTFYTRNI